MIIIALATTLLGTTQQLHSADNNYSIPFSEELFVAGIMTPSILGHIHGTMDPSRTISKGSLKTVGILAGIGLLAPVYASPVSYAFSSIFGDTLTPAQKAACIITPIVISGFVSTKLYNYFSQNSSTQPEAKNEKTITKD